MAATGRPRGFDSRARQRELIRLLSQGHRWRDAAKAAGVKPDTILGLLDRADFACVARAILEDRAANVAVTVEPAASQLAA